MRIKTLVVGTLYTNCYIVSEGDEAFIIDPGAEADYILEQVKGLKVKAILATHGHFDHILAVERLKRALKAPFLIHPADGWIMEESLKWINPPRPAPGIDAPLIGELDLKGHKFEVIHTPGHTPGSVSILVDNEILFSGDTLFQGSVGRYDFPGSSFEDLKKSIKKLMELPDHVKVYPGHGGETTIGDERRENWFIITYLL